MWWFTFDDQNKILIAEKKKQILEPFMSVATAKQVSDNFRESFVLELSWEDSIEFSIFENDTRVNEKISVLNLVKKYFSKKIRSILNN